MAVAWQVIDYPKCIYNVCSRAISFVPQLQMKRVRNSARLQALLLCTLAIAAPGAGQSVSAATASQGIQVALQAKDYTQALQLADAELLKSPRDAKVWTLKGIALSGLGRDQPALAAYDQALEISPDYLPALEGAAGLEYRTGSAQAVAHLNRILQHLPNDPTSHAMLAAIAYKHHDCPTATKHFAQSAQLISAQPAALAEYGSCLMELDRPAEAASVFRQIVTQFPDNTQARYNLAVAQLAAHQGKDAVETLQPLLETKEPDPDVLDLASSAYEDQGDTPKAVALLRQAIVGDPKKIKYYLDFAALSFNHQSFQVGIDMVNVGLNQAPKAASLYVARGILYIQLARYDKGEEDFQTAMRLDPSQASGAVAQGMAQVQQSNLDQALATVKSQLQMHPKDAFLYYMKAQILVQKGATAGSPEFKEAISAASRSTQLNPDFVLSRDVLGGLYLKSGQPTLAIEQSRAALRGNPSDQEAIYHLIQALRQSGKGSKTEMADLVKRLADLRRESREQEASANKYKLYEAAPSKNKEVSPQQ
jgi:tetratricopeptide (TPR) repeat protein